MANILIVHAHHEPQSFSSALAKTAAETFERLGHAVAFSDLYAMGFDPVSDRRNFLTTADAAYLKQQEEEALASEASGFVPELEAEMRKVEACDLLVFSFPLWWFSVPAILKGWVDRVFAYRRFYGEGKWYENGMGQGKRAMVLMTTGGGEAMYREAGMHPPMSAVLTPIHRGIFWFNGFSVLEPFIAWSAAHGTDADRNEVLDTLRVRLQGIFAEAPLGFPRAEDFEAGTFRGLHSLYMATVTPEGGGEAGHLVANVVRRVEAMRREGRVLSAQMTPWNARKWAGYLVFRERSREAVEAACSDLGRDGGLAFEIVELEAEFGKISIEGEPPLAS